MERKLSPEQELYLDRKSMVIDQNEKFVDILLETPTATHIALIHPDYEAKIPLKMAYEMRARADLSLRLDAIEAGFGDDVSEFVVGILSHE